MLVYCMTPFMLIICGNYVSFKTTLWDNKDKYQQAFALHKSSYLLLQISLWAVLCYCFSSLNVYVKGFFFFVLVPFYWTVDVRV